MKERLTKLFGLLKDYEQRAKYSLYLSLGVNLIYALVKLIAGVSYGSVWLIGLGIYYAVLAVMRFSLLLSLNRLDSRRAYLRTAWSLFVLTLAMGGIFAQMVVENRAYSYPGLLIYVMAVWAFFKIISAVNNLIKRRRDENKVLAAARCVSFAAALMSILALQTAMIQQFGGERRFAQTMNGLGGVAVTALLIALSVYMMIRCRKEKNAH
ncbi:MAG: hypothetical protein IKN04_20930 [Clostridia bacterium]|nr:hypothetical protein [Clostridia bacterium]